MSLADPGEQELVESDQKETSSQCYFGTKRHICILLQSGSIGIALYDSESKQVRSLAALHEPCVNKPKTPSA